MTVEKQKLGLEGTEMIEILDVKQRRNGFDHQSKSRLFTRLSHE